MSLNETQASIESPGCALTMTTNEELSLILPPKLVVMLELPLTLCPVAMAIVNRSGLWMLAGFLLLGWVMARMTVQRRRRRVRQNGEDREIQRRLDAKVSTALPLSDAPIEVQRWQVAMFDLQRELKGELDSRIAITQSLMRQLDQRIAVLQELEKGR
ncbi:hypothetical protein [Aporhodopirellula aestuarii]|uniref:Transmembrane protein n=1 Tax=Aporhodopirellula aestuarii TaxID=2950107 RepID=A0ABT0U7V9_9BACT|nr:hypothetical protein [Aporhodopirellula aestuarii]MCM2373033.1 hypothetical protein [Aporhodopirellula aestuarii]